MARSSKRWLVIAASVAVLGGGFLSYHLLSRGSGDIAPFRTEAVRRDRIVTTVTASGTLSPVKTVQVGSQVSGRVLELLADFNSVVKKGDLLARIDPRLFQSDVARAQANLTSARAGVVKAQASHGDAAKNVVRAGKLFEKGLISEAERDTTSSNEQSAAAQKTVARADVSQAAAALEQARINLTLTEIHSPIDGVVISRDVSVGQTVAASLSAPTLYTIAEDMRAMEVHTSVAESDVGVLRPDMAVTFTVDAFPGERFKGTVTQIRNAPVTLQNVVTYDAVVRVDNAELKLRPGMTANASFVVADRKDVIVVPSTALRFTPRAAAAPTRGERSARRVWVLDGDVPRAVVVQTGASNGRLTEILGGELTEGMLVITGENGDDGAAPAPAQQARRAPGFASGGPGGPR